jgi:hypothetical protein
MLHSMGTKTFWFTTTDNHIRSDGEYSNSKSKSQSNHEKRVMTTAGLPMQCNLSTGQRKKIRRGLTVQIQVEKRKMSILAYKKYIRFPKDLLTSLKALRQMFKSKEDPPLALEAESSN